MKASLPATRLPRLLVRIQVAGWSIFYALLLLYSLQKWEQAVFSILATTVALAFYVVSVYGHLFLLRRYAGAAYGARLAVAFPAVAGVKMLLERAVLFPMHGKFYNFSLAHVALNLITLGLAFGVGAVLYLVGQYFHLRQRHERSAHEQLAAQLRGLKMQIQPHFLFNTLNNIYYLAQGKDDRAPDAIARLSGIMRYFIENASSEQVPLRVELQFIEAYMALEQMRIPFEVPVQLDVQADPELRVPPMLLLPLVENLYKHGIDKSAAGAEPLVISLVQQDCVLVLQTRNPVCAGQQPTTGTGLANLEKRLRLLYDNDFQLRAGAAEARFHAHLQIPVA